MLRQLQGFVKSVDKPEPGPPATRRPLIDAVVGDPRVNRPGGLTVLIVELPNAGSTVTLPTQRAGSGDPRLAIEPDIPFALKAADFFAGKDPALELALK